MAIFYPLGSPFSGPIGPDGSMVSSLDFGPQPSSSMLGTVQGLSAFGGGSSSSADASIGMIDGALTDIYGFTVADSASASDAGASTSDDLSGSPQPLPVPGDDGSYDYNNDTLYPMTGPRG